MKVLPFVAIACFTIFASFAHAKTCTKTEELRALALNMYHEARGEGFAAMQMVGEVTLNRVSSALYPKSICAVVYQKSQFSWTVKKDKTPHEKDQWELALNIASKLVNGDINYFHNGATHFVNPKFEHPMPKWTKKLKIVVKVGNHVFYSDEHV
jgi:spore germination cell wall hydrolase CwlJ-like protein